MLDLTMNIPFFQRGDFPAVVQNGSEAIVLANPWINGTVAAPFDQRGVASLPRLLRCLRVSFLLAFYLILDVAVGGTNGWFPDGSGKPWLDGSTSWSFFCFFFFFGRADDASLGIAPMLDFWRMKNEWLATWPDNEGRSMVV